MRRSSKTIRWQQRARPGALLLPICLAVAPVLFGGGMAMAGQKCEPTRPDSEGPFYRPGAPARTATGVGLTVSGRLLGAPDCRPLSTGRIEWWHANASGDYDDAHRGSMKGNADETYRYTTDVPDKYPGRPLHIHVRAFAPGYTPPTTQFYLRAAEKGVAFDIVLSPLK